MTNEELNQKYENAAIDEIIEAINSVCTDDKEKVILHRILRSALHAEENTLKEKIKQENEDSKEEKAALKATHAMVFDRRKVYLESYREMNKIMTSKSMLKHLDEFKEKVEIYNEAGEDFSTALNNHIAKLEIVKNG